LRSGVVPVRSGWSGDPVLDWGCSPSFRIYLAFIAFAFQPKLWLPLKTKNHLPFIKFTFDVNFSEYFRY